MNHSTNEELKSQSIFRSGWEYVEPCVRARLPLRLLLIDSLIRI